MKENKIILQVDNAAGASYIYLRERLKDLKSGEAKNIGQYYQKANDFVEKGYTNIFKEGADRVYYNVNNNL